MTEFKRTVASVDAIEQLIQVVLDGGSADDVAQLSRLTGDTGATVQKMGRKAAESDPTKQLWGQAMREKVNQLVIRWSTVESLAVDVLQGQGATPTTTEPSTPVISAPPARLSTRTPELWQPPASCASAAAAASATRTTSVQNPLPNQGRVLNPSPSTTVPQRDRAALAAEARMRATAGNSSTPSSSQAGASMSNLQDQTDASRAMEIDSGVQGAEVAQKPIPIADSMGSLMRLVHLVFLRHGFANVQEENSMPPPEHVPATCRIRYVSQDGPVIQAVYVPVQRHLVVYASLDGHDAPTYTTMQVGMAAGSVQAKADYLLVYPLLYRQCEPSLAAIPPEVCFSLLTCMAIPTLAALGCASRTLSNSVFQDDVLWLRVLMALDADPAHDRAMQSVLDRQQRGEGATGEYRRLVRVLVEHARHEAEERRRREEERRRAAAAMDPLRIGPPRHPRFPGGPGVNFPNMIGGDRDLMPGGGFFPGPFGGDGRGPRPFGGGGGGFGMW